ncbi:MAG: tRNA pseudouridine(38-40) synthase TruA [Defluviicoccus sp.]|nr:tRNA pseudouridine(38-40) synthase TruA [Defluviicoccus sp.]MDE0275947.1 tRNA pseudouridine(38-40) synthase TruA [Defluviicoccus sp.]
MTRWRITVEYDGTGYVGWQRQDNGPSIQEALETAIARFCGETPRVFGAGRTDAGVHASGQVAHFDLEKSARADTVADALNAHLRPEPIAVLDAAAVESSFDARLSARERAYLYRIVNRRAPLTTERGHAWLVQTPLDAEAMGAAAARLLGKHDFSTFRASLCQARSPVKTLDVLEVAREGEEIRVRARARSFLHHQVRNIVGTLKLVGEGKWSADDVAAALEARDRRKGGPTAPACGLYLREVLY